MHSPHRFAAWSRWDNSCPPRSTTPLYPIQKYDQAGQNIYLPPCGPYFWWQTIHQPQPSSVHGMAPVAEIGTSVVGLYTPRILATWILPRWKEIHTGWSARRSFPRADSQAPEGAFAMCCYSRRMVVVVLSTVLGSWTCPLGRCPAVGVCGVPLVVGAGTPSRFSAEEPSRIIVLQLTADPIPASLGFHPG